MEIKSNDGLQKCTSETLARNRSRKEKCLTLWADVESKEGKWDEKARI